MRQYWANTIHRISSSATTRTRPSPTLKHLSASGSYAVDARMVKTGFDPNTSRRNFQMEGLLRRGEILSARKLFDQMPSRNIVSVNTLISGYVKSGDLRGARELFDGMTARTNVSWTIIIGGYARFGHPVEAFRLYCQMYGLGMMPDHVTFTTLLSGLNDVEMWIHVIQVHAHILTLGFESVLQVCNTLVDCYSKSGHLDLASRLFNEIPQRDSVTYNSLIAGYSNAGLNQQAVDLFFRMQNAGFEPSEFTFAAILSAATGLGDLTLGHQVHGLVIKTNFAGDVFMGNALLDLYSKHHYAEDAKMFFSKMPEVDGVSYNVIISCLAWEGKYEEALDLFQELQYLDFIRAELPFSTLLSIAANTLNLEMGRQIHCQCIVVAARLELQVGNALVDMYAKCGQFKEANMIFKSLAHQGKVPWTAMISALVQKGLYEEGLKIFLDMHRASVGPDQATFASILRASASLASLSLGKQMHSILVRSGFLPNVFCGSALIDMYAKCGSMVDGIQVFKEMPNRNIVSWNALLSAYAQNGDGSGTIELFKDMVSAGLHPDSVSFLNILTACSHSGLVKEGLQYFDDMTHAYHLEPRREHYASIVDVLCRSGLFDRAERLMAQMPFEPDDIMLSSVLNSCRIHKNQKLAKKVADQLFNMELKDAAAYVNMSNIYAGAGQWHNVAEVKKAMRDRGIKKEPAYSWVEVEHKIHIFSANDKSHPQWKNILRKIDSLSRKMEEQGHKPDTGCALHNWDENVKAESLKYHSERIAIAFALISTPEGSPILVMKNLRTCADCHAAIKVISKIVGREITELSLIELCQEVSNSSLARKLVFIICEDMENRQRNDISGIGCKGDIAYHIQFVLDVDVMSRMRDAKHLVVEAYKFIYVGCSQEKYQPSSPFQSNLNSFFSWANSASQSSSFNSFASGNDTEAEDPEAAVYGLYQCRGDLTGSDCANCIQSTKGRCVG
ncbi:hypothetical protein Dimus_008929 [Dionaea muscipula]